MGAKESPEMKEARRLVIEEKLTPYAAAKRAGVSRQSIYMSAWYKKLEKPNPEGQENGNGDK